VLPAPVEKPAAPLLGMPGWGNKRTPLMFGGIGLGVVAVLITGLFIFGRRKKAAGAGQIPGPAAIDAGSPKPLSTDDVQKQLEGRMAEQQAEHARLEVEALMALKLPVVKTKKTEVLMKHIAAETKTDADSLARVVRTWLNG